VWPPVSLPVSLIIQKSAMRSVSTEPSEEDPLLPQVQEAQPPDKQTTPLPKLQLSVLLLLQLAEPISSFIIFPFINQVRMLSDYRMVWLSDDVFKLVGELDITGGDPTKVGYYAGEFLPCYLMYIRGWRLTRLFA
jgi:hypothetical protein